MCKIKTTEALVNALKRIFGDSYDYSEVVYVNMKTKVSLICKIHGKFEQVPMVLLKGFGCLECKKETERLKKQEEFIKCASEVHKYRYDYSLVNYVNNTTKVKIICPVHGVFEQTPKQHKNGCSCFMCANENKRNRPRNNLTTLTFIEKANSVHNNTYDYSLVDYKNNFTKVKIICPIHGVFELTPAAHLRGLGCLQCGLQKCIENNRLTYDEFIKRSINMHSDAYDYSLAKEDFIDSETKVRIICKKHNFVFYQTPIHHMKGHGCPKCAVETVAESKRLTIDDIILKSNEIYGEGRYDYSLTQFNNVNENVKIICLTHGVFEQNLNSHLRGHGCPKCAALKAHISQADDNETFIVKARAIHGDKYDYSLVLYYNYTTKVKIVCPIHGVFEQDPEHHLRGLGCPLCSTSKGENKIINILKELNIDYKSEYYIKCPDSSSNEYYIIDFVIDDFNLYIEYNGEQHYRPVDFYGGLERFSKQQVRDEELRNYCAIIKKNLIEIPYDEKIDVKSILNEFLLYFKYKQIIKNETIDNFICQSLNEVHNCIIADSEYKNYILNKIN